MALPVEHDLSNLSVQVIDRVLQTLGEFVRNEVRLLGPTFETLSDQVVGKALELLVRILHLVVLRVEQD